MKIAVIGSGIAGLSAAWLLRRSHQVTLFEADNRAGGHADTQLITMDGHEIAVDMGFIVYNTHNYPHLTGLFEHLGIPTRHSDMSFGISVRNGSLEYGGGDIATPVCAAPQRAASAVLGHDTRYYAVLSRSADTIERGQ